MDIVRPVRRLSQVLPTPAPVRASQTSAAPAAADSLETQTTYEPPLLERPACSFHEVVPVTLFGRGLGHRRAVAVCKAVENSAEAADALLADYFSPNQRPTDPNEVERKMRQLLHLAARRGPQAQRNLELCLACGMSKRLLTDVMRGVKHALYMACVRGCWKTEALACAEHLLQLQAARPEHANVREHVETRELRRLMTLRRSDDLTEFYATLCGMAGPEGQAAQQVLFQSLQRDLADANPVPSANAAAVIRSLQAASPLREVLLHKSVAAKNISMALRFFTEMGGKQAGELKSMLQARSGMLNNNFAGMHMGGHPYAQLAALLGTPHGTLRHQLMELLTAWVRYDLVHFTLPLEELTRRMKSIGDWEVRLRVLKVACERPAPSLVTALASDGEDGIALPALARPMLPAAIMGTRREVVHVVLGDVRDRVWFKPHLERPHALHRYDLARWNGDHRLGAADFTGAVRDLGRQYEGTTIEPLAHHSRVTAVGVEHTLLRRIAVPGAGRVHATLRCDDAAETLQLLRSGNWEAKTLSGTERGEMVVAALHSELQIEQEIVELEPKALMKALRKKRQEGWRSPSSYVRPDGRHRVLLTRSLAASAQSTPTRRVPWRLRAKPAMPVAEGAVVLTNYRDEADYAHDCRFDGSSVAHIEPEDFVTLAGGEKPYGFHVLDLVGAIVSQAKRLRDVRKDESAAWNNPLTRGPLLPSEIATLRAHPHGWALQDVPLPADG